MTLSIFKFWWENLYEIKDSSFHEQWFFKPILTETYILLHGLHHFFESMSFKKPSRRAAAVHKVHSYLGEKQNCQNALIARDHAKNQFLTTSPGRERDSCLPIKTMDLPKSHVLKRLVKSWWFAGRIIKNIARHAGETHNNKRHPFGADSFTCTGMRILMVKITKVNVT